MGSMYGIFAYIWPIFMVNVGVYIYIPYMDPLGYEHDAVLEWTHGSDRNDPLVSWLISNLLRGLITDL